MSALRVACRTPWGDEHDLVVIQRHVIVPRELGHVRALSWLGDEHHACLAVTSLSVLERQTSAELGNSPYCVPIARWNAGAQAESWLPVVPATAELLGQRPDITALPTSRHLESLPLPRAAPRSVDLEFGINARNRAASDRLRAGSNAVSRLLAGLRRLVVTMGVAAALLACAYYLAGAALWLWNLREGMTSAKIQEGVVLVFAGLLLSAFTGLFRERFPTPLGVRALPYRSEGRERQPLLYTALDVYRLGISLQLLAFGAFVIF